MRRLLPLLMLLFLPSCRSLGDILQAAGFTELRTPSMLYAPGSLVWIRKDDPFDGGIICTPAQTLGADFVAAASPSKNLEVAKQVGQDLAVDANVIDGVHAAVGAKAMQSVTMTLKNVQVLQVTDYDVVSRLQTGDPLCRQMVAARRKQGKDITIISSALLADVVYSVQWSDAGHADASAQTASMQQLAIELGLDDYQLSKTEVSATGLYWGITDDQYLAHLFDPANVAKVPPNSRLLAPRSEPALRQTIDLCAARAQKASQTKPKHRIFRLQTH